MSPNGWVGLRSSICSRSFRSLARRCWPRSGTSAVVRSCPPTGAEDQRMKGSFLLVRRRTLVKVLQRSRADSGSAALERLRAKPRQRGTPAKSDALRRSRELAPRLCLVASILFTALALGGRPLASLLPYLHAPSVTTYA